MNYSLLCILAANLWLLCRLWCPEIPQKEGDDVYITKGRKVVVIAVCHRISIYIMLRNCLDNMKTDKLLLTMIVAAAILVTPSVLTSPVLAQVPPGTTDTDTTEGTTGGGTTGGTTADESPRELYQTFQSCLETAEGTETFAEEPEIRDCFIEAGYTGAGDDTEDDEDENEDDDDENENGDDEETN
jgi:hypothetical protein